MNSFIPYMGAKGSVAEYLASLNAGHHFEKTSELLITNYQIGETQ